MAIAWRNSPRGIALLVAAAALIWVGFGPVPALGILAAGLGLMLLSHLRNLELLAKWLNQPIDTPVPHGSGVWADVLTAMHRRAHERTSRQQELSAVLAQLREAVAVLPDGFVLVDGANRIEWSNPSAESHLGIAEKQDAGQPLTHFVRQPEFVEYLGSGDYHANVVVTSTREPVRLLAMQVVPYGHERKLLVTRDITELTRVEIMRRDFIANVSHELKTPLTVVAGFVETLGTLDLVPQEQVRYLELMREQTLSMQRLVADLLTLSALESPGNPLHEEHIHVRALLTRVRDDAVALGGGHQLDLDAEDADLIGSETEIASALANLVTNAVRYTPGGGCIRLLWRRSERGAEFAVEDSGIGIAPEHIARLTERFYRVDRGRSRATGGTGLGLAIVKHVAVRHQAELEVQSELGKGSRFALQFPAERVVDPLSAAST